MSRVAALIVAGTMVVVLLCCPQPALAQTPKVVACPITHEPCETKQDCDPPAPDLTAAQPATPPVVIPLVATLAAAPRLEPPQPSIPIILTHWFSSTRTVVLRI